MYEGRKSVCKDTRQLRRVIRYMTNGVRHEFLNHDVAVLINV